MTVRSTLLPTVALLVMAAFAMTPSVTAQESAAAGDSADWREILPGVTIGSQMRFRTETRRSFRFDDTLTGDDEDLLLSRFRFDAKWEPSSYVTGVVELQDARLFGEEGISDEGTPNIFADRLDVHQAYVDVRASPSGRIPVTLRAGRQKIAYGSQRLVSPLEWVNTARVFDGIKVSVGAGMDRTLDGFATRLVPVSPNSVNDHGPTGSRMFNSQLHGIYYTDRALLAGASLEAYWLLRRETGQQDDLHTVGGRFAGRWGPWALDGELAGQGGAFGGDDHRATMLHVGGGFTTTLPGRPTLGVAWNYGSGDDDPTDAVHRTFDNLYPLNHAYYGAMDFFALQNLRNLEVSVDTTLPRGTIRVAYQHFALVAPETDAWYNAGAGRIHLSVTPGIASSVGSELDITVRVPIREVRLEAGYGHFFGGAYVAEAGFARQSADFFYLQSLIGF